MQKIKIDGKSYSFPTLYSECSVELAKKVLSVWDNQAEEFRKMMVESSEDIEEEDYLNFLVHWVSAITKASTDLCKIVHFVDLEHIWKLTQFVLSTPSSIMTMDKLKGVPITESVKTLRGVEVLGGKATYQQWSLLNKINVLVKEAKEVKKIDLLKSMLTVVYPVKEESKEDLKNRLDSYDKLSLLELYSGWFFFAQLLNGWKIAIQHLKSDLNNSEESRKARIKLRKMQLLRSLENSIFGRFTHIIWQKQMSWLLDLTK